MALFRKESVWHIANKLDILLPGKNQLVAPSAMVQARQRVYNLISLVSLAVQWPLFSISRQYL